MALEKYKNRKGKRGLMTLLTLVYEAINLLTMIYDHVRNKSSRVLFNRLKKQLFVFIAHGSLLYLFVSLIRKDISEDSNSSRQIYLA